MQVERKKSEKELLALYKIETLYANP
jgi:hypothetical protein